MDGQALALNSNWLDTNTSNALQNAANSSMTVTTGGLCGGTNTIGWTGTTWYWPYGYWVSPSPARPIKLTLSEIERLRKAAKADKAIKAILAKFTDQIEITVDFE